MEAAEFECQCNWDSGLCRVKNDLFNGIVQLITNQPFHPSMARYKSFNVTFSPIIL